MNTITINDRSIPTYFKQLGLEFDAARGTLWLDMKSQPRPCFTPTLLDELRKYQRTLERGEGHWNHDGTPTRVDYQVLTSSTPGVFNLGGDLHNFLNWIREGNREALSDYARSCVDVLYPNIVGYNQPVTTISLVRGQALGGGFEAALSSQIIIAESGTQMGLPEILFNLFPGMGAYALLCRRVAPHIAEKMILSGRLYSADELHEMGIVDHVCDPGQGVRATERFIARHRRSSNGFLGLQRARQVEHRITAEEMLEVTDIWVDSALMLNDRDQRTIERLVRAQDKSGAATADAAALRAGTA